MSRLYVNTVAAERARGCVFAETFEDSLAVAKNSGTINGDPTINFEEATFDGVDDYIDYSVQPMPEEVSISCKVSMASKSAGGSGSNMGIVGIVNSSTSIYGYLLYYNEVSSRLEFSIYDGGVQVAQANSDFNLGERYSIVATYDGTTLRLYVNGVLQSTTDTATSILYPTANIVFQIGRYYDNNNSWHGSIKDLKIWDRALTVQEALDLHLNDTWDYDQEHLVCHLPMTFAEHDPTTALNAEKLTDGDMEAPTTAAWTVHNSATVTKETTDPHSGTQCLRLAKTPGTVAGAYQTSIWSPIGGLFRLTGWARSDGTAVPRIGDGSSLDRFWVGTTSTDWQEIDLIVTSVNTTFYITKSTAGNYVEFDDLSIKQYAPRTLDDSGFDNHATFGDGTTLATFPTKYFKKGYTFDGTDDYMLLTDENIVNSQDLSIVIEFYPEFEATDNVNKYLIDSSPSETVIRKKNNASSNQLQIYLGNTIIANIAQAAYAAYWYKGRRNVIAVTSDGSTTDVWLNGQHVLVGDTTVWTPITITSFYIGTDIGTSDFFPGKITDFRIYHRVLTELQLKDIMLDLERSINKV